MQTAEAVLAIVGERGRKELPLGEVYRQLYNQDLYLRAYGRLYRNQGAMTKGAASETVDGMSQGKIADIIELLRHERFRWTPVRRVYIPKKDGKLRPLGIPTWRDKLLQEVMRSILEAYYEPRFSPNSHGFRPERGCHTALKDVFHAWKGTRWFIEGDIRGCFDNIDHPILLSILRENIQDNRFMNLVKGLLEAGYLEDWNYRPTLSGTPQGGIVSPILANIYLDKLDKFVETTLIPEFNKGKARKKNQAYERVAKQITKASKEGAEDRQLIPLRKQLATIQAKDQFDPDYRRLRYIRYADDFLLGFAGPRDEAEDIKGRLTTFLRDNLKLEMSAEKTLITHAGSEMARFLGYDIGVNNSPLAKRAKGNIKLRLPPEKLDAKIAKYVRDGKAIHRSELLNDEDFTIVAKYGSELRGFAQYYAFAGNRHWISRLQWYMSTSMLKTLAAKHKATVKQMARRYKAETHHRGRTLNCFEVKIERPDKEPLIARFGGIRLMTEPFLIILDLPTDQDRIVERNELVARLLADTCELCGSKEDIQVHHIRKLADLKAKGRREKPLWIQMMAARRRKTLVVCRPCHDNIHAGRPIMNTSTPKG